MIDPIAASPPPLPTPEPDPRSSARAAEALRRREPGAEALLVESFGPAIRRLRRATTRDAATADDLFQETFTLALVKLRRGEVRSPESLLAYLSGLARNLARYHYRRAAVRERRESPLDDSAFARTTAEDPLARLLVEERLELLQRAVAALGVERDREALRAYYLAEEDGDALCRRLGIDRTHLKRVLHRARERCRRQLEHRLGPDTVEGH